MKNVGAYFEYEEERNRDLMRVFRRVRAEMKNVPLPEIYRRVVSLPSVRFWVSEERAAIVVSNIIRGRSLENMRPTKREMYMEIYRRVCELRKRRPHASVYDLVFDVVNSPAPKFYLTPGSAKVIIHKVRHEWYKDRRRRPHRSR